MRGQKFAGHSSHQCLESEINKPWCFTKNVEDVGPVQVKADFTGQRQSYYCPQLSSWNRREKYV